MIHRYSYLPILTTAALGVACGTEPADSPESPEVAEAASYLMLDVDETAGEAGEGLLDSGSEHALADELSEALPDPSNPPEVSCDFDVLKERVRDLFDLNDDGRISDAERAIIRRELHEFAEAHPRFVAFMRHHRARLYHRLRVVFDENDDGTLDAAEREALVLAMEARCSALRDRALERFDADGDGALDADERAAARSAVETRLRAAYEAVLAAHDADGDGELSAAERRAWRQARREEIRRRVAERRGRIDTDGDGRLSAEERAAYRAQLRERFADVDG